MVNEKELEIMVNFLFGNDQFLITETTVPSYILMLLRERDHWGDQEADGRIILRWIFRKREGVVRTGRSWLRIGTGGEHL